ncbi:hypothetical protein NFJ02_36g92100 [Pycnococcus provasolii]
MMAVKRENSPGAGEEEPEERPSHLVAAAATTTSAGQQQVQVQGPVPTLAEATARRNKKRNDPRNFAGDGAGGASEVKQGHDNSGQTSATSSPTGQTSATSSPTIRSPRHPSSRRGSLNAQAADDATRSAATILEDNNGDGGDEDGGDAHAQPVLAAAAQPGGIHPEQLRQQLARLEENLHNNVTDDVDVDNDDLFANGGRHTVHAAVSNWYSDDAIAAAREEDDTTFPQSLPTLTPRSPISPTRRREASHDDVEHDSLLGPPRQRMRTSAELHGMSPELSHQTQATEQMVGADPSHEMSGLSDEDTIGADVTMHLLSQHAASLRNIVAPPPPPPPPPTTGREMLPPPPPPPQLPVTSPESETTGASARRGHTVTMRRHEENNESPSESATRISMREQRLNAANTRLNRHVMEQRMAIRDIEDALSGAEMGLRILNLEDSATPGPESRINALSIEQMLDACQLEDMSLNRIAGIVSINQ